MFLLFNRLRDSLLDMYYIAYPQDFQKLLILLKPLTNKTLLTIFYMKYKTWIKTSENSRILV